MRFSALILAGGASARMGRDKAWIEVDGQPLIQRQIQLARVAGAAEVFVSGRRECDYHSLTVPILYDEVPGLGPLAGVEQGLSCSSCDMLLVLAVDLARLSPEILKVLRRRCRDGRGAVPWVRHHPEPLAAFYPRAILPMVTEQLRAGRLAMRDLVMRALAAGMVECVELGLGAIAAFANWNEPRDLRTPP
jgi:molybdopterin-guanine dinucleotide biosynthesis protein A